MDYFAHAGHMHESSGQSFWHSITNEWYIALPLYVLLLIVLTTVTYFISHKSKSAVVTVLMAALLVGGVGLYSTSAIVSVVSLAAGFALALSLMVAGLGGGHHLRKKS